MNTSQSEFEFESNVTQRFIDFMRKKRKNKDKTRKLYKKKNYFFLIKKEIFQFKKKNLLIDVDFMNIKKFNMIDLKNVLNFTIALKFKQLTNTNMNINIFVNNIENNRSIVKIIIFMKKKFKEKIEKLSFAKFIIRINKIKFKINRDKKSII